MAKRVLLVADIPHWTWGHRARDIQAYTPPEFDVDVLYMRDIGRMLRNEPERVRAYDAVFDFSWAAAPIELYRRAGVKRLVTLVTSNGPCYDRLDPGDWNTWVVTKARNTRRAKERLRKFDAVICVNERILECCLPFCNHCHLIPSGVNTDVFCPGPKADSGAFRVGWCANIKGIHSVKGYREVLESLMDRRIPGIEWSINIHNHENPLSRDEMVAWYQTLDAFLCTSINEGTPSPLFEAAACGVPIVSTAVGMVRDWPLPRELGLLVPAYRDEPGAECAVGSIQAILERLRDSPSDRAACSKQLREDGVRRFSYRVIAPQYLKAITGEV